MADFKPSPYQEAILAELKNSSKNIMVQAVAGSGKTSTLKLICETLPRQYVVALAFNKVSAEAFKEKLPAHIESSTMHSYGFTVLRKYTSGIEVDQHKQKRIMKGVIYDKAGFEWAKKHIPEVQKIADMCVNTCIDPMNINALSDMVDVFGLDIANAKVAGHDKISVDMHGPIIAEYLKQCRAERAKISFDDMIDQVVHHQLTMLPPDLILGDEVQDWNKLQAEFIRLMAGKAPVPSAEVWGDIFGPATLSSPVIERPTASRVVLVGDRRQSIYSFRGADPKSMDSLSVHFAPVELPLSVCYRCPRSVIALAQEVVGDDYILPADTAEEGEVLERQTSELDLTLSELKAGDMVMCRVNAPLVPLALRLIAQQRRATVRGSEATFSKGLIKLVEAAEETFRPTSLSEFLAGLRIMVEKQIARLCKHDKVGEASRLEDRYQCIRAIAEDSDDTVEIVEKIEKVFDDTEEIEAGKKPNLGVIFSSVHRAKGREAETAVILAPHLMPHPAVQFAKNYEMQMEQEMNCKYVAITRALKRLVLQRMPQRQDGASEFSELNSAYLKKAASRASAAVAAARAVDPLRKELNETVE
jgi:superfamily I DNA/RNA helicase